jgi:hypothetical protein
VLDYMRGQSLTSDDIEDLDAPLKTKGVFSGLKCMIDGIEFKFGTGGIHGSVKSQKIIATDEWLIRDIDVASLYPSIAIVNRLAPEHLGEAFIKEYSRIPVERAKYKKGTVENASYKLAANGTYGKSNSKFSVFFDPKFTMTITINGQLLLCMLAEWLLKVPTLQLIQINTDGITYRIHKNYEPYAKQICQEWEKFTCLTLEDTNYSRMFIRDVNNYVAEELKTGKLKQKGAYWHPDADPKKFADSISKSSPPAWHKDFNPVVVPKVAVICMLNNWNPAHYIRMETNKFDFMLRAKVDRQSKLMLGNQQIQGTSRYYVSTNGQELKKISPPPKGYQVGQFKRASKISDLTYNQVMQEIGTGVWVGRIHTKNKSRYEMRETAFNAGWRITECNNAVNFDWSTLNYDFYINEIEKLIIK